MKRFCKSVDITNRDFIKNAVNECLHGGKNGTAKISRRDTMQLFSDYSGIHPKILRDMYNEQHDFHIFDGIIETIVDSIRHEIIERDYLWKPIWHTYRIENEKVRRIGIQDIKQQLYDYIAVNGLKELLHKKIGYYQCAALPNKGQVFGKNAVKKWVDNPNMRYAWKGDAKHYYENINIDILKKLLNKYVKNEPLLHLVFALIDSFEKGLEIGSYLSQYLANFYMSFAYHYASEKLYKVRNSKRGGQKRVNLIHHVLIYMDDILFIGSSEKDLKSAVKQFKAWINETLDIDIKDDDSWYKLHEDYIDIMGFYISRKKVITRFRIFKRLRRTINKIKRTQMISELQARAIMSRKGWLDNANCKHWMKKNKMYKIIRLCKEVINSEKDVIRFTTVRGRYHIITES